MGDVVVGRQRAESLEFRHSEEGIAHLLQRPFASSVNTHNSQPFIIICQVGGTSGLCGDNTLRTVVSKVILT